MAIPRNATELVVVDLLIYVLSIIAVYLRLWSRRIMKVRLVLSDYLAIAATIINAGAVANTTTACFIAGMGRHLQEILQTDPTQVERFLKIFVAGQLLWAGANTCVKYSILLLYTAIFPNKKFASICYATIGVTTAYFIMVILEGFVLCTPVQYTWDQSIPGGHCDGQNIAFLVAGIVNLVIDAFIVALPMPMLLFLHLSLPKKFGIAAMFSLGAGICVISLLRVVWLVRWDLTDLPYTVIPLAYYSQLEPFLGVINACLPTIRPAVDRIFKARGLKWSDKDFRSTDDRTSSTFRRQKRHASRESRSASQELEDQIPLTDITIGNSVSKRPTKRDNIVSTRGWDIEHSNAAREELPSNNWAISR